MKNIERTILSAVVIALSAIIILTNNSKCNGDIIKPKNDTIVKVIIKEVHDTIKTKPKLIKSEPIIKWDTVPKYIPDTNYHRLLNQYIELGDKHFSRNVYTDSVNIDTLGSLKVLDTVVANKITGRTFEYTFKKYETTKTIIIHEPYKPVHHLYFGGGLTSSKQEIINSIDVGLLFKSKNDQIIGIRAGIGVDGTPLYGFSSYWKIKLKK